MAGLDQVMALAPADARLESVHATGVRSDGTMDLMASDSPAPRAVYTFHREVPAPKDAAPIGAGGSIDGRWFETLHIEAYQPGKRRQVTSIGGKIAQRFWFINRGLEIKAGSVSGKPAAPEVPRPACGFSSLWDSAIARGAPAEAVAQFTYDARGYLFNIPGVFTRRYRSDCAPLR
jgi:hypothetical protein